MEGTERLREACCDDNLEEVMRLVSEGVDMNARGSHGWSPLHYCAFLGRSAIASYLINAGADVDTRSGMLGVPLHYSTNGENIVIARLLIANGADVNAQDSRGDTPLHKACAYGSNETIYALIKAGADTTLKSKAGRYPLDDCPVLLPGRTKRLISRILYVVPLLARTNVPADLIREFTLFV